MTTYQDLLNVGENENKRMQFIVSAIADHKGSPLYKIAFDAEEYDRRNNVTIMQYQKVLFTLTGRAVPDIYSANHKMCSNYLNMFVTEENQYLLGNGMKLENDDNKAKLGKDFDQRLQAMGRNALVEGVSFGFWNLDHLETFRLTEFVPLYDEETGALMAGIRFWQVAPDKPERMTLYEPDGYTDYMQSQKEKIHVLNPKRSYIQVVSSSAADGMQIVDGQNYPGFPVIPMWANPHHQSEFVGMRESIDAYDLISSGAVNDLDGELVYWVLKNSGGMDDVDIAKFMERLRSVGVAMPEDESDISPHEIPIPYEAREACLARLEHDMYRDCQMLNVSELSASAKTATEIKAAYQPFDNKVDGYEYCVLDFLNALFDIVGIEDNPTFTRNKVASANEDLQTLLLAADYLDMDYVTRKACSILGDPDAAQDIIDRRAGATLDRLMGGNANGTGDTDTGDDGGDDSAVTD